MTNATATTTTTIVNAAANKVTRRDALVAAIAKFNDEDPIRATLEKMLEQVNKPRTGESPAQAKAKAERMDLMNACVAAIKAHPETPVNSTWLASNVDGVRSTQKATVLMGMAIKAGMVEKTYIGKKVYYTAM